ncbi:MAG: WD40/YVTN/BNR-like repeat-containing protein, partial [Myxococcales bacterium]
LDSVGLQLRGRNLYDVEIFDANNVFAVGTGTLAKYDFDANVFRSETDLVGSTQMNAVAFVSKDVVVAVGNGGTIFRRTVGTDGAPAWTKITAPNGSTAALNDVKFYGQTGYIVGGTSTLWVSTDGGATWTPSTAPNASNYSITRLGPNEFFIGSGSREIVRSELGVP